MRYLTREQVMGIHERILSSYGGLDGVRDSGLLDSAINMPRATFDGMLLHSDVPSACSAYLFHLCENHPFNEGNKRTASMCAYIFAEINGWELVMSNDDFEALVMGVASGRIKKTSLTGTMRDVLRQKSKLTASFPSASDQPKTMNAGIERRKTS